MTDGNRAPTPVVTAGLDLGDKYSYLCLIDQQSAEVMEEGRLRTTPRAFLRRFDSEQQMTVAIEAGTHSPWVSRKLEEWLQGLGGQPAQDEADLWSRAKDRQARCREVVPSCPSGPKAALAVGASERDISGAPSAHPLARGSGPLSRSAHQSRARNG